MSAAPGSTHETSEEEGVDASAYGAATVAEDRPLRDASLLRLLYRDPDHAPEHLVLAAVEKVGPQSQAAVAQLRRQAPGSSPRELAERVVTRTVRIVRTDGAIMGTPFLAAVVPAFVAVLWHQAQMVLRLAALSGRDPAESRRASEVLLLQGAFKSREEADSATTKALDHARGGLPERRLERGKRILLIKRLVAVVAGGRKVRPIEVALGLLSWPVCILFPLTAVPIMSAFYERATRLLGRRALDYYLPATGDDRSDAETATTDWRRVVWYTVTVALAIIMIAVPLALLTTAAKPLGVSWDRAALGAIVLSLVIGLFLWSNRH